MTVRSVEAIQEAVTEVREAAEATTDVRLISGSLPSGGTVKLDGYSLLEAFELAVDLNVGLVYLATIEGPEEELEGAQFAFFTNDRAHVAVVETADRQTRQTETTGGQQPVLSEVTAESEDERERKEQLADQILGEFEELLSDSQEYRLRNHLDHYSVPRLLQLQERKEETKREQEAQERIDEELEDELARAAYEDDRFNRQFNKSDTRMLIQDLDLEYDADRIRFDEVHRKAKSLLKINR
jgi:hypothetical protein